MANKHSTLTGLFTDIADAIRVKTGGTDNIVADEFPEAIAAIDTQEDLDPELATQDDLIAQIAVALEGKTGVSGGSSVTIGEATQVATDTSITIADLIGKDNVILMYMDDCSRPSNAMADSGIVNIIIHDRLYSYVVHYSNGLLSSANDGCINYDKTTGCIDYISSVIEKFIAGKYMYVAWSGDTPVIITFIIHDYLGNTTSYQAEEGMSWGEWVNSSYNTGGYKLGSEKVNGLTGTGFEVLDSQGGCYLEYTSGSNILSAVSCDQIIANVEYMCTGGDLG